MMKNIKKSGMRGQGSNSLLFSCSLFAVQCLLLSASAAFASGGGGEEAATAGSIFKSYIWQFINFASLVSALVFMMKKMDLKGFFKKRTELIEQSLREAREAKELAQKALAEVEASR